MKKIAAIIVATMIMINSITVMADIPDISQCTDEEIVQLLQIVNAELVNRNINRTANIQPGEYIGGKDIPVGSYELHIDEVKDSLNSLYILKSADDTTLGNTTLYEILNEGDGPASYYITLGEGYVLNTSLPCTLTISNGITFQ